MKKSFKRDVSALEEIFRFVDDFLVIQDASEKVAFATRLAVEELFTNLVRHNIMRDSGSRDITISLERDSNQLVIRLKDFKVKPFEIPENEDIGFHQSLHERKVGGLGVHLVRNLVDKLTYEYKDGNLCVTVIKNMENEDV